MFDSWRADVTFESRIEGKGLLLPGENPGLRTRRVPSFAASHRYGRRSRLADLAATTTE